MGELIKKGLLLHVAIAIVCMLSAFAGGAIFGIIVGGLLYAAYILMMYGEGCSVGEHHCTMSATLERLASEGKTGDEKLQKNAFDRKKAFKACAVLSGIPLVLAILNLILANPATTAETPLGFVTRLVFLPQAFITRWCSEAVKTDISGAIAAGRAALNSVDYGTVDFSGLIKEASKITTYAFASDTSSLTLMRILYIPAGVLPGIAQMIGYLQGPRLRAKTVEDMLKGSRKKQRRILKARRQRQNRQAKPEV